MSYHFFSLVTLLATAALASPQENRLYGHLPSKVNLELKFLKLGIEPRSQGGRPTCGLFTVTAVAEFEYARANPRVRKHLSEEFLIWAANEAGGLSGDQKMSYEMVHGLNTFGICSAELMPYEKTTDARRAPSQKALADAQGKSKRWKIEWIKRWDVEESLTEAQLLAIKSALANGHPVVCGLRWPKILPGAFLLEVPPASDVFDGHSIVFTGYEEDARKKSSGIFYFRNTSGPQWGRNGSGVMSYSYARAYANDVIWLELGAPDSETPIERFEAESMTVFAKEKCETTRQKIEPWHAKMWSQGEHLLCMAEKGGSVELGFQVRKPGRYRLRVLATAAPDFGIVRVSLDGKPQSPDFDLYSGRVCPAGSLELGGHELTAGIHKLRFIAATKSPASTGFFFGLDAVDLLSAK
jgi:hypothetical protein